MIKVKKVRFYDAVSDGSLKFAVIVARSNGKLVFCKHRLRDTYEIPGGHREAGEDIADTARRELYEETGAVDYDIKPICVYSVVREEDNGGETETYGMLYFADVRRFEDELHNEIERIVLTDTPPAEMTYPDIQPKLLDEVHRRGLC